MDPKKIEMVVSGSTSVVVGSCVLMMNTDDAKDLRNGFLGKIISEERIDGLRRFVVRWFTGVVDDGIKPEWVAHV